MSENADTTRAIDEMSALIAGKDKDAQQAFATLLSAHGRLFRGLSTDIERDAYRSLLRQLAGQVGRWRLAR